MRKQGTPTRTGPSSREEDEESRDTYTYNCGRLVFAALSFAGSLWQWRCGVLKLRVFRFGVFGLARRADVKRLLGAMSYVMRPFS